MLEIQEEVLNRLTEAFRESDKERGFLLGCTSRLDSLDRCEEVPAIRAGMYFYEPDPVRANGIVHRWASEDVCFCGFIHSHVVDKPGFSEPDIEFAKRLLETYHMPGLWFGLGTKKNDKIGFCFAWISINKGGKLKISSSGVSNGTFNIKKEW